MSNELDKTEEEAAGYSADQFITGFGIGQAGRNMNLTAEMRERLASDAAEYARSQAALIAKQKRNALIQKAALNILQGYIVVDRGYCAKLVWQEAADFVGACPEEFML